MTENSRVTSLPEKTKVTTATLRSTQTKILEPQATETDITQNFMRLQPNRTYLKQYLSNFPLIHYYHWYLSKYHPIHYYHWYLAKYLFILYIITGIPQSILSYIIIGISQSIPKKELMLLHAHDRPFFNATQHA